MEQMNRTTVDPWTYGDADTIGIDVTQGLDLSGYSVEATDGGIGKIDEATYETSRSYLVVDTGPWIFGKKGPPSGGRRAAHRHGLRDGLRRPDEGPDQGRA